MNKIQVKYGKQIEKEGVLYTVYELYYEDIFVCAFYGGMSLACLNEIANALEQKRQFSASSKYLL